MREKGEVALERDKGEHSRQVDAAWVRNAIIIRRLFGATIAGSMDDTTLMLALNSVCKSTHADLLPAQLLALPARIALSGPLHAGGRARPAAVLARATHRHMRKVAAVALEAALQEGEAGE